MKIENRLEKEMVIELAVYKLYSRMVNFCKRNQKLEKQQVKKPNVFGIDFHHKVPLIVWYQIFKISRNYDILQ